MRTDATYLVGSGYRRLLAKTWVDMEEMQLRVLLRCETKVNTRDHDAVHPPIYISHTNTKLVAEVNYIGFQVGHDIPRRNNVFKRQAVIQVTNTIKTIYTKIIQTIKSLSMDPKSLYPLSESPTWDSRACFQSLDTYHGQRKFS